jgi:hypothetical protein
MRSLVLKSWPRRCLAAGGLSLALIGNALGAEEVGHVSLSNHCAASPVDCYAPPPAWVPTQPERMAPVEPGQTTPDAAEPPPPPSADAMTPDAPLPEMAPEPLAALDPGQSLAGLGSTFAAPNMIGDLFSPSGVNKTSISSSFLSFTSLSTIAKSTPDPTASVVGLQRIAENNSPIPRDRVFLNYSFFDNTPLAEGGIDVHRLTPGFERTFNSERSSLEVRVPVAHTLDTDLTGVFPDDKSWELGDVTLVIKTIVAESNSSVMSVGFAASLPTTDDLSVFGTDFNGQEVEAIRVEREATYLMPFVGGVYTDPYGGAFVQGFMQGVFNSEDDNVRILDANGNLVRAGSVDAANLLMADVGMGYWVYQNSYGSGITAIAPTAELHWTRSLERTNAVVGGPFNTAQIGRRNETIEILNAVLGVSMVMGDDRTLTVGMATPLINDRDTQFDYEVRVLFNWFYGAGAPGSAPTLYR